MPRRSRNNNQKKKQTINEWWGKWGEIVIGAITFAATTQFGIFALNPDTTNYLWLILFSLSTVALMLEIIIFLKRNFNKFKEPIENTFKVDAPPCGNLARIFRILNFPSLSCDEDRELLYRRLGGLAEKIENQDIKKQDVDAATGILKKCSRLLAVSTRSIEWLFEPSMIEWLVCQVAYCRMKWRESNTNSRREWDNLSLDEKKTTGFTRYLIYEEAVFREYQKDILPLKTAHHHGYIRIVGLKKQQLLNNLELLIREELNKIQDTNTKNLLKAIVKEQFNPPTYPDFVLFYNRNNYCIGVAYRDFQGAVWIRHNNIKPYPIEGVEGLVQSKIVVKAFVIIGKVLKRAEQFVETIEWLDS